MRTHRLDAPAPYLGGEHRAEPVPPIPDRFVADLDPALVEQVLDIAQRQREANVEHHRQADDLGACLEVLERGAFRHLRRLAVPSAPLQEKFF
jgi:hypothetical protein